MTDQHVCRNEVVSVLTYTISDTKIDNSKDAAAQRATQ